MQKSRQRILCVDDNADIREMLTTLLCAEGYDARAAATVDDAKLFAAVGRFDLFILEKMPPRGAGLELCRYLRRLHPHTPVIIYSADASPKNHLEAAEAGATACVDKPNISPLVSAVNRLSKERSAARALNPSGLKYSILDDLLFHLAGKLGC